MKFIKSLSVENRAGYDETEDDAINWMMEEAERLGANALVELTIWTKGTSLVYCADAVFIEDPLSTAE